MAPHHVEDSDSGSGHIINPQRTDRSGCALGAPKHDDLNGEKQSLDDSKKIPVVNSSRDR